MNKNSIAILSIATVNGAIVMAFEIIGSRVLAPTFGGSIFVWGSLIGVFMAGLAAGYFLGGWLSDRKLTSGRLAIMLFWPGIMLITFPSYGYVLSEWIFLLDLGPRLGPLSACFVLFFIPTMLMGAVSPYLIGMRLADRANKTNKTGMAVGLVYALSTVGSIAGTLGAAFYLILAMGVKASMILLGGVLIALSALALYVNSGE